MVWEALKQPEMVWEALKKPEMVWEAVWEALGRPFFWSSEGCLKPELLESWS